MTNRRAAERALPWRLELFQERQSQLDVHGKTHDPLIILLPLLREVEQRVGERRRVKIVRMFDQRRPPWPSPRVAGRGNC
jgi:hypothetical protein